MVSVLSHGDPIYIECIDVLYKYWVEINRIEFRILVRGERDCSCVQKRSSFLIWLRVHSQVILSQLINSLRLQSYLEAYSPVNSNPPFFRVASYLNERLINVTNLVLGSTMKCLDGLAGVLNQVYFHYNIHENFLQNLIP